MGTIGIEWVRQYNGESAVTVGFVSYVAAVELDSVAAKRQRWSPARPSLLVA